MPAQPVTVAIEALDPVGMGLAQAEGRTVRVQGALPGERVSFVYTRIRQHEAEGRVEQVLQSSAERVEPGCPHFGVCGGCSLQHLAPEAQRRFKQQLLLDTLHRVGEVAPEEVLAPLASGTGWGYRQKARLGVKYVVKKHKVLVGFRERGSGFLTDTERCPILDPRVGELIAPLSALIDDLSIRDRVPQIEVAMGDETCVLVFRLLAPPPAHHQPPPPKGVVLSYLLPREQLQLQFLPGDFTQVNAALNRQMVARAVQLLELGPADRVLDLFCGLGNFTLPIARHCLQVTGVEGDDGLVARARENARRNHIDNARFFAADLYREQSGEPWLGEPFDKALLDPPRSGAREILRHLPALGVRRIVYVSCYPETLARDAGELVGEHGYRLLAAGMMDMFPHTAHMESIALFQR